MAAKPKVIEPEFRVPSLAECDPQFAALLEKREAIASEWQAVAKEKQALARDLEKNGPTTGNVSPAVAEALGDVATLDERPKRLLELRQRANVLDEATAVLVKRIQDRRSVASGKVCEAVKSEFAARVKALAAALEATQEARRQFENLLSDLEAEDVSWSRLGVVRPAFLGDHKDGHIPRFLKEIKEAGYV